MFDATVVFLHRRVVHPMHFSDMIKIMKNLSLEHGVLY